MLKFIEIGIILEDVGYNKINNDLYKGEKFDIFVTESPICGEILLISLIKDQPIYSVYYDCISLYDHINKINEMINI